MSSFPPGSPALKRSASSNARNSRCRPWSALSSDEHLAIFYFFIILFLVGVIISTLNIWPFTLIWPWFQYVLTFQWAENLWPSVWWKNCSGGAFAGIVINSTLVSAVCYAFSYFKAIDTGLKLSFAAAVVSFGLYLYDLLTYYAWPGAPDFLTDGFSSAGSLGWWVDVLGIRLVQLFFVITEGYRARMKRKHVALLGVSSLMFGQQVVFPVFLLMLRRRLRKNEILGIHVVSYPTLMNFLLEEQHDEDDHPASTSTSTTSAAVVPSAPATPARTSVRNRKKGAATPAATPLASAVADDEVTAAPAAAAAAATAAPAASAYSRTTPATASSPAQDGCCSHSRRALKKAVSWFFLPFPFVVYLLIMVWNAYTWLSWLSAYQFTHCWLDGTLYDANRNAASRAIMHEVVVTYFPLIIWIWSVDRSALRAVFFSYLAFNNVAASWAFYLCWREWRNSPLASGNDADKLPSEVDSTACIILQQKDVLTSKEKALPQNYQNRYIEWPIVKAGLFYVLLQWSGIFLFTYVTGLNSTVRSVLCSIAVYFSYYLCMVRTPSSASASASGSGSDSDSSASESNCNNKEHTDNACALGEWLHTYEVTKWSLVVTCILSSTVLVPNAQLSMPMLQLLYVDYRSGILGVVAKMSTPLALLSVLLTLAMFFGPVVLGRNYKWWVHWSRAPAPLGAGWKIMYLITMLFAFGRIAPKLEATCTLPLGVSVEKPLSNTEMFEVANSIISQMMQMYGAPHRAVNLTSLPMSNFAKELPVLQFKSNTTVSSPLQGVSKSAEEMPRLIHPRAHGCVAAKVSTPYYIPAKYRYGWLAQEHREYNAYVRFSNGAITPGPDKSPDVRGMAVKLLGVEGVKALGPDLSQESQSQDILLVTSPYFFQADAHTYGALLRSLSSAVEQIKWTFPSWDPRTWRLSTMFHVLSMTLDGRGVTNPLDVVYYSAVPYRMGPTPAEADARAYNALAVKYKVEPCRKPTKDELEADKARAEENPNSFLRANMQSRLTPTRPNLNPDGSQNLQEEGSCFDFFVQDQFQPCMNPIDDPTVVWQGEWTRVARIDIPKQYFLSDKQLGLCENLSFHPWHSLKVHEPLGAIGQARLAAYVAGAAYRRFHNRAPRNQTGDLTGLELTSAAYGPFPQGDPTQYDYASYPSPWNRLPRLIATLPTAEKFPAQKTVNILTKVAMATLSFGRPQNKLWPEFETADDLKNLFTWPGEQAIENTNVAPSGRMRLPDAYANWTSDEAWAAQYIRGLNPLNIYLVSAERPLPKDLYLTAAKKKEIEDTLLKNTNDTFASLIAESRLFAIDMKELTDISTKGDRIMYAPIALFYLTKHHRKFLPLLIQLERPSADAHAECDLCVIYTPLTRPANGWLFAKMHFGVADSMWHQLISHLLECHLIMEPMIIAAHRQLSRQHPVFKTLKQHWTQTLAINDFGRATLIAASHPQVDEILATGMQGGLQLMQNAYLTHFSLKNASLPLQLKSRGFNVDYVPHSPNDVLPGYIYRDFTIPLYNAERRYVHAVLSQPNVYGPDPVEALRRIKADKELNAWLGELRDPTLAAIPDVPDINSLDDLVEMITTIIFIATAQHASVNFPQYNYYGFQPAKPLLLTKAMPSNLSVITDAFILQSLPDFNQAREMITIGNVLTMCCQDTLTRNHTTAAGLDDRDPDLPLEWPAQWKDMTEDLRRIEGWMYEYNRKHGYNYPYLYPSRIPASIAI